ncbi:MAG TPA: hypothetical protein VKA30_02900 [Actinomycetota bacterium]|nr:hypothetical protein [Actinomycetota bacterium]
MNRARWWVVSIAVLTAGFAGQLPGRAATSTPPWVKHVQRFPGGISGGVRAYIDPAVEQAKGGTYSSPGSTSSKRYTGPSLVNVQANTDTDPPLPQNETAVAYNPGDTATAVASSNDYVDGGVWTGTTHNGGKTWVSQFLTPRFHSTGDFCTGGDPTVVYSVRDSAFYQAQLCFFRAHPESEIQVIRSTDNGDHWTGARYSSPVITNATPKGIDDSVFYDKELLAVDNNPSSPFYGRLYMTYIKFHLLGSGFSDTCPLQIGYTDDIDPNGDGDLRDAVWTNVGVVPDDNGSHGLGESANQGASPVIDDQGGVDIAYNLEECNTSIDHGIRFKRSTDGGASWPAQATMVDHPGQYADNPSSSDLLPPKNARFPNMLSMAFNPTTKSLGVAFQNFVNMATSGADIAVEVSDDYGATWGDAYTASVLGDGSPAPNDQFFPALQPRNAAGWRIIFQDNRYDPGNLLIGTTWTRSNAAGTSWVGNRQISTALFDPNESFFASGSFIGDYIWYAASSTNQYAVWADGRNTPGVPLGQTDIFTVPNP